MPHFDPENADCLVFTYREGLLSAVAHDLELRVTRFSVDYDETARRIEASFDPGSLCVVRATRDGREVALGDRDRREIEHNITREVLEPARYGEIRFLSRSITNAQGGHRVSGTLTLHGQAREITFHVDDKGGYQIAECTLHQPDFGIKPYRALMGALKVRADVRVRLRIPYRLP